MEKHVKQTVLSKECCADNWRKQNAPHFAELKESALMQFQCLHSNFSYASVCLTYL